jgi:hypothetical protein
MNKVRLYIGAGLVLIGATLIPVSLSHAKERPLTYAQKVCLRNFNHCQNQCSKYKAPELVARCRESCTSERNSCMAAASLPDKVPHKKSGQAGGY